jgi:hypothetical protein
MLDKILNIFNKEKTMEDSKVDQEVIAEEVKVKEEVKKEKAKKEDKSAWFTSEDGK